MWVLIEKRDYQISVQQDKFIYLWQRFILLIVSKQNTLSLKWFPLLVGNGAYEKKKHICVCIPWKAVSIATGKEKQNEKHLVTEIMIYLVMMMQVHIVL